MCDDLVVSATLPLCQPPRRCERAFIVKPRPFRCCGQAFCLSTDAQQPPATVSTVEIETVDSGVVLWQIVPVPLLTERELVRLTNLSLVRGGV